MKKTSEIIDTLSKCPFCKSKIYTTSDNIGKYDVSEDVSKKHISYFLYNLGKCENKECNAEFYGAFDIEDEHTILWSDNRALSDNDKGIIIIQSINNDILKGFKEHWRLKKEEPRVGTGTVFIYKEQKESEIKQEKPEKRFSIFKGDKNG